MHLYIRKYEFEILYALLVILATCLYSFGEHNHLYFIPVIMAIVVFVMYRVFPLPRWYEMDAEFHDFILSVIDEYMPGTFTEVKHLDLRYVPELSCKIIDAKNVQLVAPLFATPGRAYAGYSRMILEYNKLYMELVGIVPAAVNNRIYFKVCDLFDKPVVGRPKFTLPIRKATTRNAQIRTLIYLGEFDLDDDDLDMTMLLAKQTFDKKMQDTSTFITPL